MHKLKVFIDIAADTESIYYELTIKRKHLIKYNFSLSCMIFIIFF